MHIVCKNRMCIYYEKYLGKYVYCAFLFFLQVIFIHDVSSTYRVPILLEEQGIMKYFKQRLNLPIDDQPSDLLMKWKKMADRYADSCCSFGRCLNSG